MISNNESPKAHDPEARDIKKKIIEAASSLFEKKGLYETSVAEVAEAAGISAPVTYHYLKRKSDIMYLIMEYFTDQFKDRVLPEIEQMSDTSEKIRRAMEIFFKLVEENLVKVVLVYRESRTLDRQGRARIMAAEIAHQDIFKSLLDEGVEKGIFKPVDTDLAAYNMIMAGHTWALKSWHFRKRLDLEEFTRLQTDFILDSLAAR